MTFYKLVFVGLMRLADRTDFKGISEHVAAWGIGLILQLNLIAAIGLTPLRGVILRPLILIPTYIVITYLNFLFYDRNRTQIDKLLVDQIERSRPNMTPGELAALVFLGESVIAVLTFGFVRQSN
jgi:hypothetical protein